MNELSAICDCWNEDGVRKTRMSQPRGRALGTKYVVAFGYDESDARYWLATRRTCELTRFFLKKQPAVYHDFITMITLNRIDLGSQQRGPIGTTKEKKDLRFHVVNTINVESQAN
jgi:hypothetical protein